MRQTFPAPPGQQPSSNWGSTGGKTQKRREWWQKRRHQWAAWTEDVGAEDVGAEDAGAEDAGAEDAGAEDAGAEEPTIIETPGLGQSKI